MILRPVFAETVTLAEAARRLGMSERTLRHWVELGHLTPARRTPTGRMFFSVADIDALAASMVVEPHDGGPTKAAS